MRNIKVNVTKSSSNQSGQALLVVLLALAVILTVVLSIASRSVTELTITKQEEDSARALSAAEAGVEKTLITGTGSGGPLPLSNNATYSTSVVLRTAASGEFVYPEGKKSGEGVTFWLVSHDVDGSLTCAGGSCFQGDEMQFCWGDSTAPASALEVTYYYDSLVGWAGGDFSNVKVKRLF